MKKDRIIMPQKLEGRAWLHAHRGPSLRTTHRHDELEFNLVLRGQGTYILKDQRIGLRRNSLLWLFPDQDHILLDSSTDFQMWILVFRPRFIKRMCEDDRNRVLRAGDPPGYFCRRLTSERTRHLDRMLADLPQIESQYQRYNAGLGFSLLTAWDAFEQAREQDVGEDLHPAVERAAYMIQRSTESQTLPEIARQAGLSAPRLSRLFKAQTGIPLVAYRNRQMIERFLELYGEGHRFNMLQAALSAGFGSYAQFHRVFKQVMGCGPAAYRRREVT